MFYKRKECILSLEQLNILLDDWQKKLGLKNWDIRIKLVKQKDIEGKQAEVSWNIKNRAALLKILLPEEYDCPPWEFDMEVSLVHELVHLNFAQFDLEDSSKEIDIAIEQTVEQLAITLVGLKRGDILG